MTDKIINLLENGVVPWRRPWTSAGLPRNLVSKKPYRGINHFLLSASKYVSPFWLTIRQANELGGHVRKGEESTIIVFWKVEDRRSRAPETSSDNGAKRQIREGAPAVLAQILYRVFNLEQCEAAATPPSTSCRRSKRTSMIPSRRPSGSSPECPTRRRFSTQGQRRSTARSADRITSAAARSCFASAEEYYATAFHETVHSTGHEKAPCARRHLRKSLRSVPPSIPKRN